MTTVAVNLEYVHELLPDRIAVFDFSEEHVRAVHNAGLGVVIVAAGCVAVEAAAIASKGDQIGHGMPS